MRSMRSILTLALLLTLALGMIHAQEAQASLPAPPNAGTESAETAANPESSAAEGQAPAEEKAAEEKTAEEEIEDAEESLDLIEAFYKNPSFGVFPSSRTFRFTNTVSGSIFYDSNVFLTSKDEKDDFGYTTELISHLEYRPGRFQMELIGALSYENYFDHSDLGEFQPRAQLVAEYEGDTSYYRLEENFVRHSTVATVEFRDRSPWYENRIDFKAGKRTRRWLVEGNLFHTIVDYRGVAGDHLVYGGGLLAGYNIGALINATFDYQVHWIDYREALVSEGEKQRDTVGHNFSAGLEIQLTRQLMGRVKSGVQYREGQYIWSFLTGATWYATPYLQLEFKFYRGTEPTFYGDYKEWTDLTLEMRYLLRTDLALRARTTLADSRPLRGVHSQGWFNDVFLTYNVYEGIVTELFYRGDFVDAKDSDADYVRHRIGLSLRLVF